MTETVENIKVRSSLQAFVVESDRDLKNDDSIPTRSNKKTGAKSKKEVREQVN